MTTTEIDTNHNTAATTAAIATATTSMEKEEDGYALDDLFESEIARMSQDTDAILDSIRHAARQTPTARRKAPRRLHAMLQKHNKKKNQQQHHHNNDAETDDDDDDDDEDHDIDTDDDMTDDGSVPEEVRRKIQDELTQLDTKFSTDPDGFTQEIRGVSMESPSPLAAMHADEELVMMKDGKNYDYPNTVVAVQVPLMVGSTVQLAVQAIVVWLVIFAILVRIWHKGMLDENGLLAWPVV